MPKIFNRGELKQALLAIVGSLGTAHGYAIMQELQRRVGRGWRPSPGAIYPALVALEEEQLLLGQEKDGLRVYTVTPAGEEMLKAQTASPVWQSAGARLKRARSSFTVGAMLDQFARGIPQRKRRLDDAQAAAVATALREAGQRIADVLEQGEDDG